MKPNKNTLPREFFTRQDVVLIARQLLGKVLYTCMNGEITSGIITETEAYAGITDKASHAFNGTHTARKEVMYRIGGTAYVYLCYGIHSLFNVVTSVENEPHAILIRGILPLHGKEIMEKRIRKPITSIKQGLGPGKVASLLAIHYSNSGIDMCSDNKSGNKHAKIWIEDAGIEIRDSEIIIGPRVGVAYAGADALLPYRFMWEQKK